MFDSYIIALIGTCSGIIGILLAQRLKVKYTNKNKLELTSDETIVNAKDIEQIEDKLNNLKKEINHLYNDNKDAIIDVNIKINKIDELVRKLDKAVAYIKGTLNKK